MGRLDLIYRSSTDLYDNMTASEKVAKFGVPIKESYHIEKR